MTKPIQLRGHCQACCRIQAVSNGTIAKHGYTVKERGQGGWFEGICPGTAARPVQVSRELLDVAVRQIRAECDRLVAVATDYRAGTKHPDLIQITGSRTLKHIDWDEASPVQRRDAIDALTAKMENRARSGYAHCEMMLRVADDNHGNPLIEVAREQAPPPVLVGDRRINGAGRVAEAKSIQRGMVNWMDDRGFKGRTSTRGWRLFTIAPAA